MNVATGHCLVLLARSLECLISRAPHNVRQRTSRARLHRRPLPTDPYRASPLLPLDRMGACDALSRPADLYLHRAGRIALTLLPSVARARSLCVARSLGLCITLYLSFVCVCRGRSVPPHAADRRAQERRSRDADQSHATSAHCSTSAGSRAHPLGSVAVPSW